MSGTSADASLRLSKRADSAGPEAKASPLSDHSQSGLTFALRL